MQDGYSLQLLHLDTEYTNISTDFHFPQQPHMFTYNKDGHPVKLFCFASKYHFLRLKFDNIEGEKIIHLGKEWSSIKTPCVLCMWQNIKWFLPFVFKKWRTKWRRIQHIFKNLESQASKIGLQLEASTKPKCLHVR